MTVADLRDGSTRSERLLYRVPTVLLEYPLEVLLAAWGLISGPPLLLGISSPASVSDLLPRWAAALWAVALTVGALTIAIGLHSQRFGTTMARGLRLLGTACLVYATTILAALGWARGVPAGPLLTVIAALCFMRAWWMRTREAILRRIDEEADR